METVYLADHIKRTVTGPMWHGSALDELLAGVSPEQAAARPHANAHSIWELVLHITVWTEIARARLRGERIGDPTPEEDWPPVGATTAGEWRSALDRMREAHRLLAQDVHRLDDATLHEKIEGLECSRSTLLHGVVEHGTYHGGQIALLKKSLDGNGRR